MISPPHELVGGVLDKQILVFIHIFDFSGQNGKNVVIFPDALLFSFVVMVVVVGKNGGTYDGNSVSIVPISRARLKFDP